MKASQHLAYLEGYRAAGVGEKLTSLDKYPHQFSSEYRAAWREGHWAHQQEHEKMQQSAIPDPLETLWVESK